jgi:two-component system, chemotaxis family, protein-glutamate methylesterase/glutaminase
LAYELVVIGASAGGLTAVGAVLAALPAGFTLPIAIAQHRSTSPLEGNLAAMWQQRTPLPVREAEDKTPLLPGHVYIAPADYHLLVETRGYLALSTAAPVLWARPSIDVLFETAADAYGENLIGVILTGASADGSQGLHALRTRGGCALVQKPASAECDVMPRAALTATAVNHVLDPDELGRVIGALASPFAGAR